MSHSLRLVVEGPDDKHVLFALLNHNNFKPEFEIKDEEGFPNLFKRLPAQLKVTSALDRLGVVVDADASIQSRWDSIKAILEKAGYPAVPDDPDPTGTVIDHEYLPRVGVWIMPDNSLPGMLEDYIRHLVPDAVRFSAVPLASWTRSRWWNAGSASDIARRPSFIPGSPGRTIPVRLSDWRSPRSISPRTYLRLKCSYPG